MSVKAKTQRDYLRTEVSLQLPVDVARVDEIMRSMKSTGKLVIIYNQGSHQGANLEQNSEIPETKSEEIRAMLNIADKKL